MTIEAQTSPSEVVWCATEAVHEVDNPFASQPKQPDGASSHCDQIVAELKALKGLQGEQANLIRELLCRDEVLCRLQERLAQCDEKAWERQAVVPLTRRIAPLYRRVQEQIDYLRRELKNVPEPLRQYSPYAWAQQALRGVQIDLKSTLDEFGVEVFYSSNDRFDSGCQEPVERVPTEEPEKHGRIAKRLAAGFRTSERTIIAERVAVFGADTTQQLKSPGPLNTRKT